MVVEEGPVFVGIDLTDPYAKRRRPCTRAILCSDLHCTFEEWEHNEPGKGIVPTSLAKARFIVAVDGPQGLARSPDRTMRTCERELGVAGKSPYGFPSSGRPFAGFVTGSVKLFHALYRSEVLRLYGAPGVKRAEANLIEVYPGAAWRVFAGGNHLPKKVSRAGRQARLDLLRKLGLTFPSRDTGMLPTHDELDAVVSAHIAHLFVNGKTTDYGEPPFEDAEHGVLREGFIVQPVARREKWH